MPSAAPMCCGWAVAPAATPMPRTRGRSWPAAGRSQTPFGTFYTSNLTPDPETGIGGWSTGAFVQAMTKGVSPEGHDYYPAFPYTSYANMTLQDLADLKAYLDTVEPVANPVPPHDLAFPFGFRPLLKPWKAMFFRANGIEPDPEPVGELESRRLSGGGADPLRRVSHAKEPARRSRRVPPSGRQPRRSGPQARAQHHAARGRRHRRLVGDPI